MFPEPPLPPGMDLEEFGHWLWGVGASDAERRLREVNRAELEANRMTQSMAIWWRDFYRQRVALQQGGKAAALRAQLMEKCVQLLAAAAEAGGG
jgi:hypothetical protein